MRREYIQAYMTFARDEARRSKRAKRPLCNGLQGNKRMTNQNALERLFPFISGMDAGPRAEFHNACTPMNIEQGRFIADSGSSCRFMPFVLSGCIKIFKLSPEGREITLFRVTQGDCCIMSAACILGAAPFPAMAMAEEAVSAAALPAPAFTRLFAASDELRRYIMRLFAGRLASTVSLLEEVTFKRMDKRLADFITSKQQNGKLAMTHEAIANELGTAREVVSRLLNEFQKNGCVRLSRGELAITNSALLRELYSRE